MTYPWLTFHTSPEDRDLAITREIEWEIEGVERGINRAREIRDEATHKAVAKGTGGLADMDAGAVMVRDILRPMIPAVERLQAEAMDSLHSRGNKPRWALPILSLEPEKWALITARSTLTGLTAELKDSRPATPLAIKVANHGMLQREFDLWRKSQAEARKADPDGCIDLYKLMLARVKRVNERTVRKWMALTAETDRLEWTKEDKVHAGLKLLEVLVTDGGGWFEMVLLGRGIGRMRQTVRHVRLTDVAKDWIKRFHAATELHRPFLAPMLCPPDPWRWEEPDSQGAQDADV